MASQSFVSIEIDKKTLDEVKTMLSAVKNGARDAVRIAANKTGETARSRVVKKINETVTLTQKRIREDTKLDRANFSKLSSKVTLKSKPIPIVAFKHGKQLISGINIEVRRGKKIKYKHRFIAQMPSKRPDAQGHIGIFERKLSRGGKPVKRLPIEEQYGPSTALVFHNNGEPEIFDEMSELFQKRLLEQALHLLRKAN